MARLVIGGHPLFIVGHDHRLALDAHQHLVLGVLEIAHRDHPLGTAGGKQRRFVDEVGKIGAREPRRAARNGAGIDVGRQRHLLHVDGKDLLAALDVGATDDNLAIKPARAQQCRIENIGAVGCSDDDDAFIGIETVHFDQQLVQGLLAFVVAATKPGAA